MKRRDLIKSGMVIAGLAACYQVKQNWETSDSNLSPGQTAVYRFSRPMPYDFKQIDLIKELNAKYKKSQICTLYNSFPAPLCDTEFGGEFQTNRGTNKDIHSFEDFAKYVTYAMKQGFEFVYTLNSPKPFSEYSFEENKHNLYKLLDNLQQIGCKNIKIANQQLMEIINKQKYKFNFSVSTSSEYHNIQQYTTLIKTYPNITSINMSIDDNRNFHLLKSLKKLFPDVSLEILINEACIHGCPSRIVHPSTFFCFFDCWELAKKIGSFEYFFKTNMIYPWQLAYYSAIGINDFKYMFYIRGKEQEGSSIEDYLSCVENGIENITAEKFFYSIMGMRNAANIKNDVLLKDIISYLPDIKHFVKNGYKCGSICGAECNYCMDCAKKIKSIVLAD